MKNLPCGWSFRLPNFCKDRKCETCVLRKDKQPEGGEKAARERSKHER